VTEEHPSPAKPTRSALRTSAIAASWAALVAIPVILARTHQGTMQELGYRLAPLPDTLLSWVWLPLGATFILLLVRVRRDDASRVERVGRARRAAVVVGTVGLHGLWSLALGFGTLLADPAFPISFEGRAVEEVHADGRHLVLYDRSLLFCGFEAFEGSRYGLYMHRVRGWTIACDDRSEARLSWTAGSASPSLIGADGQPIPESRPPLIPGLLVH